MRSVDPEADEQDAEGEAEQRQPERLDGVDAGLETQLGQEPDDDRDKEERDPAQPDGGEVRDAAAGEEAGDQAEEDSPDQHAGLSMPGSALGRRCGHSFILPPSGDRCRAAPTGPGQARSTGAGS